MIYQNNITIAITSCWRFDLLKQTIDTLSLSIDLSLYPKIMTEDSKDENHIAKMKNANINWFLQWWKILYTWWSNQTDVLQCHYYALEALYNHIDTKYTFHCEDDQIFYKMDFDYIKLSYDILENNNNIAIVTLRDLYKDYGIKKEWIMRSRYYDILTDEEVDFYWHRFIYGNKNSLFNLQPWLRYTKVVKNAMFWYEKTINETLVSQRISELWYRWIYIKQWLYYNPDRRRNSTRSIKSMGFKKYIFTALKNAIVYRIWLSIKYCKHLFLTIINHGK